jgi:hypothetical protein
VNDRDPSREPDRYEKAAKDALTLLDWCIDYLANNRHRSVATQLQRNSIRIRERMEELERP